MRLVSIKALKGNEKISIPVITADGRKLLPAGATLTERIIERLGRHSIFSVYIEDDFCKDIRVAKVLDDMTKLLAMNVIGKAYELADNDKQLDEYEIRAVVREIIDVVKTAMTMPVVLYNNFAVNDLRCIHAINVCVISIVLAAFKGCPPDNLEDIAVGALLHDIKLKSFKSDNSGEHTVEALAYLRKHIGFGPRVYMTVYGHHERNDASGFPRKVKEQDIYEGAKIVAVADEYDSLIMGLSGQQPVSSYIAHEMINMKSIAQLDREIVEIFNESIALYPTGIGVALNNGENGVVAAQNTKLPSRPIVRAKRSCGDIREYNLLSERTIFVDKVDI